MWRCPNCQAGVPASQEIWAPDWSCAECAFRLTYMNDLPCFAPELIESSEGFDTKLFDILVKFEETNFWFVNRARLIRALLAEHFPEASSLMEIGCGSGSILLSLAKHFPQLQLVGSELHMDGLDLARKRLSPNIRLLQMDARNVPAEAEFDVIGAFDVIEHILEDDQVLQQMHGALKPRGGVIIAVPQHTWLWSPADEAAFHQRRYSPGELEAKLEASGFEVLRSTSFNTLLLPLMLVSRKLMSYKKGIEHDPLSEFRMAPWLNRVLSAVLSLEVSLTTAGVNWPIGGSRMVVARRN